jgi:tetratricopeptide (TPR) repeat protein
MGWRWRRVVGSLAAVVSSSVFDATAAAGEGGVEPGSASPPSAPASPEAQSLQLRERANSAYGEGRYAEALVLLEQANALSPYELHEFNLGAVHDKLGHCEQARDHFEAFLRATRQADTPVEEARHALVELYATCGHAESSEPAAPSSLTSGRAVKGQEIPAIPPLGAASPESAPALAAGVRDGALGGGSVDWRRTLGVCLLGSAAAAGIAATVAGIRVRSAEEDLRDLALRVRDEKAPVSGAEVAALDANGRRYQALSVGLGVASAVLAGAGTTLLVLELTDDSALEVASSGHPGLGYRRRF